MLKRVLETVFLVKVFSKKSYFVAAKFTSFFARKNNLHFYLFSSIFSCTKIFLFIAQKFETKFHFTQKSRIDSDAAFRSKLFRISMLTDLSLRLLEVGKLHNAREREKFSRKKMCSIPYGNFLSFPLSRLLPPHGWLQCDGFVFMIRRET